MFPPTTKLSNRWTLSMSIFGQYFYCIFSEISRLKSEQGSELLITPNFSPPDQRCCGPRRVVAFTKNVLVFAISGSYENAGELLGYTGCPALYICAQKLGRNLQFAHRSRSLHFMDFYQLVLLLIIFWFVLRCCGRSRGHFSPFLRIRLLSESQTNSN
jgi:hypothetical protein